MSDGLVDLIREKSEEGDLSSMLKPALGGYTKRSVQEYLSFVRKQQQNLKEALTSELQQTQAARDLAQAEAAEARERANQLEAEYDSRLSAQVETQTEALRAEYAALEKDMDEAVARIREDAETIRRCQDDLSDQQQQTQTALQNTAACRAMLDTARGENQQLQQKIAEQTAAIQRLQTVEQNLRAELSRDKVQQLNDQIQQLLQNGKLLEQELALRDRELENRAKQLEVQNRQTEAAQRQLELAGQQLQQQQEQNQWVSSENEALGDQLKEQMAQSIDLSRENARLKAANTILQRKLEAALAASAAGC